MDGKLIFIQPADGTGKLVFGETGAAVTPDALFSLDDNLPGLGSLSFQFGVQASLDDELPGLDGIIGVAWDANVSRGEMSFAREHWQDGAPSAGRAGERWQDANTILGITGTRWRDAAPIVQATSQRWQDSARLSALCAQRWQDGEALRRAFNVRWQEAVPMRQLAGQRWQDGASLRRMVNVRWQEATRLRNATGQHWQDGGFINHLIRHSRGYGEPIRGVMRAHWQDAMRPPAGRSELPGPGVKPPPCYDPETLGRLIFLEPFDGTGRLVFICDRKGDVPGQPQFVIPKLEVYVTLHHIEAVLLPSLEPVSLSNVDIDADDDSFGWSMSATGPEHLLDQLAPVGGLPARIRITVDGIAWVFAVERLSRRRGFNQHRVSIEGRSVTALLGDPYMPEQSWLNDAGALTAQQIVAQALEFTGTSIDWRLNDWLVPAGVWSFEGAPLQAALRVAESVGAVLRSHRTEQQLIFAPRYPMLPWEWAAAVPTVRMPADIIVTDSLSPDLRPAFNAVFVSGMAQGVRGHVRRLGTAGDLRAASVTDALITHEVAARERGRSILGAGGNKLTQEMTLPLLTGGGMPGLIEPGYLLDVVDIGERWRGLVRGIRLTASSSEDQGIVVRQSVSVERNAR